MEEPAQLHIQLLGGFCVWLGSEAGMEIRWRRKAASLIKLLALAPQHRLHCEQVLERLWPELPAKAAFNNLHHTLHIARATLPTPASSFLHFREKWLVLAPTQRLRVDVDAFVTAAAIARRSQEIEAYEAATARYSGDLLPEDHYEDWIASHREELRNLYLDLLIDLGQRYEEKGDDTAALDAFSKVLEREPALEAAHQALMRLYHSLGQRHRALRQYGRLREALKRELGVEPDRQSHELYQNILERPSVRQAPDAKPLAVHNFPFSAGASPERAPACLATFRPPATPLSRREGEVACLIAKGLTNRQLAAELGISVRTAETLVGRILRKLRLSSRAQVPTWLVKQQGLEEPL